MVMESIVASAVALDASGLQAKFDPGFVDFKMWENDFTALGAKALKAPREGRTLYLGHCCRNHVSGRFQINAPVALKNDSDSAFINLFIVFRGSGKEIFFWNTLPARKSLHLIFLREGICDFSYSPGHSPQIEKGSLSIVNLSGAPSPAFGKFSPNLKAPK